MLALMIGGLSGVLNIVFAVSLAALIFTGPAAQHLASGFALALASASALALAGALRSRVRPPMYGLQDAPAILLAGSAAVIGQQVAPDALFPTLVALFAAASFGTGLILLIGARLRLGKVARFVPYPVIGGFLAGTGWLLVLGAFGVLAGVEVSLSHMGVLFAPGAPERWLPGALLGVVLWLALKRSSSPLVLPVFIVATTALFYGALAVLGVPIEEAFHRGLLMGPFTGANSFPPVTLSELGRVEPGALFGQAGQLVAIAIVTVISTLLNASSFEVATEEEVDLDGELQTTGIANMASGLVGGIPGFLAISSALFGHKVGLRGRAPAVIAAVVCALPLFIGMQAFGYAPKAVLGALLLWNGIALLEETVVDTARKLPRSEWLLLIGLLVLVAGWGFLPAIGAGMLIATVLFAISYGKVGAIRAEGTAATLRSRAARTETETAILDALGGRLHVLQDMLAAIAGHTERSEVEPGEYVYRQGDADDDLLVIERGELSAYKDVDGRATRLRAMGPGSIVGEVALYLEQTRSGSVRATRPSVLHRLTRAELTRLEQQAPGRAAQVHRTIVRTLAERLARATGSAQAWFR